MNKNPLIKGTLILTCAGLLTRFIGFFYRIYLSNLLGARNLGMYQLIFPIYGICFTIYASGIQTSISRLVARQSISDAKQSLKSGIIISLVLSLSLSSALNYFAPYISHNILNEPECIAPLRMLSLVFPFCGLTSCINGYYYGLKKTAVPAITQLLEQIVRVAAVYLIAMLYSNLMAACTIAVAGLVLGEIISCIYNLFSLNISKQASKGIVSKQCYQFRELITYTIPLTLNRLMISILSCIEAILIPRALINYGLNSNEALSIYGILTGMAMSFIMFPSTITNSLSVVLLPTISEADSTGNHNTISYTTSKVLHYCILIGLLSIGLFVTFGNALGNRLFHESLAGTYICILSWICPFLYITTTFASILNGLGKAHITFINSVIGVSIRIIFIILAVPMFGIYGYFYGLLISSLVITFLDIRGVKKSTTLHFDAYKSILIPGIIVTCFGIVSYSIYSVLAKLTFINNILSLLIGCFILAVGYSLVMLMIEHRQ